MASNLSDTERRIRFSERHFRASVDADVKQNPYAQIKRARMFIRTITDRYTNSNHEVGVSEVDLHDLWYLFIQAAKAISEAEPAADQLACQVLLARNFGVMSRIGSSIAAASGEQAITSTQQRIWLDLPFLIDSLQSAWATASSNMTAVERCNLAGFTARLASFGIHTDESISCALGSFAKALETSSEAEIAEEAPVLAAWLRHGGFEILSASARGYQSTKTQTSSTPGDIFAQKNIKAGPAFTITRWDFWKQRLDELQQGLVSDTAKQLQHCVGIMLRMEEMIGSRSHAREDALKAYFEH